MNCLYQLIVRAYFLSIRLVAPFNPKAAAWVKGRKGLFKKVEESFKSASSTAAAKKLWWFHCASLGEFEQGRPVIEAIRARYPEIRICLTFFSPSGYEVRKNYPGADFVFYLPEDTPAKAKRFLGLVKPAAVFFVKYEFWFNYISAIHERNIPLFFLSAKFRPNHYFFKPYGAWFREKLKMANHYFVQNEESFNLLKVHGIDPCSVSGDTRFDRVYTLSQEMKGNPIVEAFCQDFQVIIAGSTWPEDEKILLSGMSELSKDIRYVIALHEVNPDHVASVSGQLPLPFIRYTESTPENVADKQVLVIDTIGLLSTLYRYATVVYIGGGFGKGIHNILEAATYGKPVIFGPNYQKFQEAIDLLDLGGASLIRSGADYLQVVRDLLSNEDLLRQRGDICKNYVESNQGATRHIMDTLESLSLPH